MLGVTISWPKASKRGQSHILTLSLSPPPRRQQIRKTRARPHLQPGGNPLQRHLPAGRQAGRRLRPQLHGQLQLRLVTVLPRGQFRLRPSQLGKPCAHQPLRPSSTSDIRYSTFPSAALSACATHRQAVEPCRVSNIGRQSAICNLKSAIKRSVAPPSAWRQTTPNPGHRGRWLPAGRHDSSRLSRRGSERRWMVNRTGILNA